MQKIHKHVTHLYPELLDDHENTQELGYIFSCYDSLQPDEPDSYQL